MERPNVVYKILLESDWESWQSLPKTLIPGTQHKAHLFTGAGIDINDGYIHLSTASQGSGTYLKWFSKNNPAESPDYTKGQALKEGQQLLVLVEVALDKVIGEVKWELAPSRGDHFAHVYNGGVPYVPKGEEGSDLSAVLRVWEGAEVKQSLFDKLTREA